LPFVIAAGILLLNQRMGASIGHFRGWLRFISGTLFLNVVHNAFSLFLVLFVPELRELTALKANQEGPLFLGRFAALFLASFLFYFVALSASSNFVQALSLGGFLALNIHHGQKQTYGISLMYDKGQPSAPYGLEKNLHRAQVIFLVLGVMILRYAPWVNESGLGRAFLGAMFLLCPLSLMAISMRRPDAGRSNRTIYLSRLLIQALQVFSPWMAFVPSFTHGVEYLFVVRHISQRSRFRVSVAACIFLFASSAFLIILYVPNPTHGLHWIVNARTGYPETLLNLMVSVSLAFTLLHYYFDRVYFRMADPLVRNHMAPLLA
jgi:hypothetical protein